MVRTVFGKAMWVGRATIFLMGMAMILALVFGVATKALGATGSKSSGRGPYEGGPGLHCTHRLRQLRRPGPCTLVGRNKVAPRGVAYARADVVESRDRRSVLARRMRD
jgi:hypothetical protein